MKKLIAILVVAVMALMFVACSAGDTATTGTKEPEATTKTADVEVTDARFDANNDYIKALAGKKIGVANIYLGDEWCRQIADAFTTYGEMYGFEVNNQDGEITLEKQVSQIENFIAQEYDYLFVDVTDDEGIKPTLDDAKEKGIPVITFDATSTWEGRVAFVTASNYNSGRVAGEKALEYIEKELGGKAKIVALTLAQPHTMERLEGFKSVFEGMDGIEIITEQDCQGNRETAANIINGIAEDYNVIFSVVPNGAMGALSAVEALQKENVKIIAAGLFASDAFDKLRENSPYLMGGCTNDPVSIVTMVLELAGKNIQTGEVQEDTTYFTPTWIDAENVNERYPVD